MKAFDDILDTLDGFGPYQKRIYILLGFPAIFIGIQKFVGVFTQFIPSHRCKLPSEGLNASYALSEAERILPIDPATGDLSQCSYYTFNKTIEQCSSWVYDRSVFTTSTISEWDLVCDMAWYKALADSLFMIGEMFGSTIFGWLSDRIGRKRTFFLSLFTLGALGFSVAFSPNISTFLILRFLIGSVNVGTFLVDYVLALELVGPSIRTLAGIGLQMFFTVGALVAGLCAFFIREWRKLQIILSAQAFLFGFYWNFIPESSRWLLSKGRYEEAKINLRKLALVNNKTLSENSLEELVEQAEEERTLQTVKRPTVFDIYKHKSLRNRFVIIFYLWFANNLAYYCLSWNTGTLFAGDVFLNYSLTEAVEIPAYLVLVYFLHYRGRRLVLSRSMLAAGLFLIITAFIPLEMNWLKVSIALIGKMVVTSSYGLVYIFVVELFPTVVRNGVLGVSSMLGRSGGASAPYIIYLGKIWKPLPLVVMGVIVLLGGLLTLLLPETLNKKLPDSLREGEVIGKKQQNNQQEIPLQQN